MATDSDNPVALETTTEASEPDQVNDSSTALKEDSKPPATVSDAEKKIRRAERFGITVQFSEQEKRDSRAQRFGTVTGSATNGNGASKKSDEVNSEAKKSEELKRKARADRFGIPTPANASEDEVKKKARLERFSSIPKVDSQEEEKRKARALRFGQSPDTTVSVNGAGNIEPKAATAGDAVGSS